MKRISTASVDLMSVFKGNKKGMCRMLVITNIITIILLIAMLCVLTAQVINKDVRKYRKIEIVITVFLLIVLLINVFS